MKMLSYENQGNNTFLVYKVSEDEQLDTMSLGMLANNRIPGLAPTMFTQMDTVKYIKYNVSAKVPASQIFSGCVNKKRLVGVFSGIADAMESAEDYMIDPAGILLDLEFIFVDVTTCDTTLICIPVLNREEKAIDLGAFFKQIMFSTQFDQTENCDYVAKIINYLNSTPAFSVADFKTVLEDIKRNDAAFPQAVQPLAQPQLQTMPVQPAQPIQQPSRPAPQTQSPIQQTPPRPMITPQQNAGPAMQQPNSMIQPSPASKVPFQAPGAAQPQAAAAQPVAPENKISLMYLLQHYNKENAAAYKAQKEAEKAAKKGGAAAPAAASKKQKKEKPKKGGAPASFVVPGQSPSFAVPGQQPQGFAVPGQQPAAPAQQPQANGRQPQGFAVPGQQPAAPAQQPQANGRQPQGFAVPGQQPAMSVPQPQAAARQPQSFSAPAQPAVTPKQPQPMNPPFAQPGNPAQQPSGFAMPAQGMSFGETTVLGGGGGIGETTVLGAVQQEQQQRPHLVRVKNNERIMVDKPVFRIGKERSYVDYFVGDNPAVSRSHANIISRDGTYFIMDTNSTNHTYVNGGMIQSNAEVKLFHGTKIRLANEEFEFRLY